ncbi:MAG: WD40 repeat domain-containing protein [bacterium]
MKGSELLLDVDRWDRAGEAAQDAAIAAICVEGFTHVRTQVFTGIQHRIEMESCWVCNYAETMHRDCSNCNNERYVAMPAGSATLSHRVAIFRRDAGGDEFVLVPGRLEIAACLVARVGESRAPSPGLRALTRAEMRHVVARAGAFDLAFESIAWSAEADHPFGLEGSGARLAASIPGAERAQADAFHELSAELGPIQAEPVRGALVRTGHGTADPPREPTAIAFSRDGRWLGTGHVGGVRVWDAATGLHIAHIPLDPSEGTHSIAFSPDHLQIVIATDQQILLCDVVGGDPVKLADATRLPAQYSTRRLATWLPDGRILAVEANLRHASLVLVDPQTTRVIDRRDWESESDGALAVATSFDGTRAAISQRHEGALAIWTTDTLQVERHIMIPGKTITDIALARDVVYLRTYEGARAHTADGSHEITGDLGHLACSPDGRLLAGTRVVSLEIEDLAAQRTTKVSSASKPFAFSPDGTRIAANAANLGFAAIWSVVDERIPSPVP